MKLSDLKTGFPVIVEITQQILDEANIFDTSDCIGARALKAAVGKLPDGYQVSWGRRMGCVIDNAGNSFYVKSADPIYGGSRDMMCINRPCMIRLELC